jgi:deoxyribonuclease-4
MILDLVEKRDRVGVCFDTCHAFAAGFDLSTKPGVESTISLFDELVGLDELKVVHLNDSKGALGSGLDRHEHLGLGKIGRDGFRAFLHSKRMTEVPLIMDTPHDYGTVTMKADLATARKLAS